MATLDFVDELLTRNSFCHGTDGSEGNQSYEEEKKDTFDPDQKKLDIHAKYLKIMEQEMFNRDLILRKKDRNLIRNESFSDTSVAKRESVLRRMKENDEIAAAQIRQAQRLASQSSESNLLAIY